MNEAALRWLWAAGVIALIAAIASGTVYYGHFCHTSVAHRTSVVLLAFSTFILGSVVYFLVADAREKRRNGA